MTAHNTNLDPRIASLTPERLTEIVANGGGSVSDIWDYTFAPEEGGDGVSGQHVLYLADASGETIGYVGFARSAGVGGTVVYTLADFLDYRYPTFDGREFWLVTDNVHGFLGLLTVFVRDGIF